MSEDTDERLVESLEAAVADVQSVDAEIDEVGPDRVERLADAYGRFDGLLSRYREPASGSGRETFKAYVEFEGELDEFVNGLPEDLLYRDAFEDAAEVLNRRRLEERDFDHAREMLEPARDVAELIEDRETAREQVRAAGHAVASRRREIEDRIEELEGVLAFDDVDFDVSIEAVREPIEAYEEAVDASFQEFLASESARDVLRFVESTEAYPLVSFPTPPDDLYRYVFERPAGEEPIPTLLSWADFTRSKLDHYVPDPGTFRAAVGGNRTYLARLGPEPLHVGWPPPPAETLQFRTRELVAVVDRFAPESTVERLHEVRALVRDDAFERLRRAAVAWSELTDEERRGLRDGTIHEELDDLREERDRLARAIDVHRPA